MICESIEDFTSALKPRQRLLGIDLGEKNIGLALSDDRLVISSPYKVIKSRKFSKDAEEIIKIINEMNIGGLVIGLPINMDGTRGPKMQSVQQFARNFLKLRDIPVFFQDERLSTSVVERAMIDADVSRQKRAEIIDKTAAAYILQTFLEIKNR